MEEITLVLTALAAGASAGTLDALKDDVKDKAKAAYARLDGLVRHRFRGNPSAEIVLSEHRADPETYAARSPRSSAKPGQPMTTSSWPRRGRSWNLSIRWVQGRASTTSRLRTPWESRSVMAIFRSTSSSSTLLSSGKSQVPSGREVPLSAQAISFYSGLQAPRAAGRNP